MKLNLKKYIIIMTLLILLISIIINSKEVMNSVILAINIWKHNIFPALFPLFIITDLLINYDFINILGNILYKPMHKIFKFNKSEIFIFFISMLSGFPSSGKYCAKLYKDKLINLNSANRMLMCSHFSNPLFIFGTIYSLINNKKICLLILISHYLGNFFLAIFTRKDNIDNNFNLKIKKQSFSDCLTNSISTNANNLIFILSSISIFLIITTIINKTFYFNNHLSIIISGIFEMTQGIKAVSLANYSLFISAILITFFISFGGVSVHLQTLGMINGTDLSYKEFLKGRIIHSTLSVIFIIILFNFL